MNRKPGAFLSFLLLFLPSSSAAEVDFGDTKLIGKTLQSDKVEFFGGIPYAEPPIDDLRLRRPVLKDRLDTPTFNATEFGPACLQAVESAGISNLAEDCLTINIYRPVQTSNLDKIPVMVFIYGGGFTGGGASIYDGSFLVSRSIDRSTPIIYASFNYRLGALGWPQGAEAAAKGLLNLGLKDQLAALEWIQKNIHHFGGDSDQVTVFGESAGAVSIGVLYFSGLEKYARGAIFESGAAGTTYTFSPERRQGTWDAFVDAVPQCNSQDEDTLTCLRNVNDSSALLNASNIAIGASGETFPFVPTLDGPGGIFPDLPSKLYAEGNFSKVPFISGSNLDEATPLVSTAVSSDEDIRNLVSANYTTNADRMSIPGLDAAVDKLLTLYPDDPALGSPFNTGNETFGLSSQFKRATAILGDLMFHSARRYWTQAAVDAGVEAYGYHWTAPRPPSDTWPTVFGVHHAIELQYVFGMNPTSTDPFPDGSEPDIALSETTMDYWISFATSGDPNDGKGRSRPIWPKYTSKDANILELNSQKIDIIPDDYRAAGIGFMNENPTVFRH